MRNGSRYVVFREPGREGAAPDPLSATRLDVKTVQG